MTPVRPLVKKALTHLHKKGTPPGRAIDLGIGRGDETRFLLKHGYKVIAIDNFKEFLIDVTVHEETQQYRDNLSTIHGNFEDIEWNTLPPVDLFIASFSLCYIQPDQFHRVWKNIVNHIKPGGYFVGQIYTHLKKNIQEDGYFLEETSERIPLLTKGQIPTLFTEFSLDYFDEAQALYTNKSEDAEEGVYSVIAQKKTR